MSDVMTKKGLIHFGTSSFSSHDWVGPFYPKGAKTMDFLKFYATHFDIVEVDSTYYSIPSDYTVDGWLEKTPPDFKISAKFPRSIVHAGKDKRPDAKRILDRDATYPDRDRFLAAMERLGQSLGPLLIQFPYFSKKVFSYKDVFIERLDRFLADLPNSFRYAVEIRNRHWLNADFAALCRRHNAALVLADQAWMPHGDQVMEWFDPVTSDFSYVRLLGNRQEIEEITKTWGKEVIDRTDLLKRWAEVLKKLADREIETYVFANNHYSGHAPATANKLREMYHDLVNGNSKQTA
jgi:uncharacterized protein YecE (DUF72 family)